MDIASGRITEGVITLHADLIGDNCELKTDKGEVVLTDDKEAVEYLDVLIRLTEQQVRNVVWTQFNQNYADALSLAKQYLQQNIENGGGEVLRLKFMENIHKENGSKDIKIIAKGDS